MSEPNLCGGCPFWRNCPVRDQCRYRHGNPTPTLDLENENDE